MDWFKRKSAGNSDIDHVKSLVSDFDFLLNPSIEANKIRILRIYCDI